uniref:Hemoglobin subunit zeta n=1 Tax=Oryctolagus cuniculus TaxID=9986 RepID=A0A5F9C4S2_RABIT
MSLTKSERTIIMSLWDKVSSQSEAIGTEALERLFLSFPQTKISFPHFDLRPGSAQLRAHGAEVAAALDDAVKNMDNLDSALSSLSDLLAYKLRIDPVNFRVSAEHGRLGGTGPCGQGWARGPGRGGVLDLGRPLVSTSPPAADRPLAHSSCPTACRSPWPGTCPETSPPRPKLPGTSSWAECLTSRPLSSPERSPHPWTAGHPSCVPDPPGHPLHSPINSCRRMSCVPLSLCQGKGAEAVPSGPGRCPQCGPTPATLAAALGIRLLPPSRGASPGPSESSSGTGALSPAG